MAVDDVVGLYVDLFSVRVDRWSTGWETERTS